MRSSGKHRGCRGGYGNYSSLPFCASLPSTSWS
jgi:hypothetical protein